MPINMGDKGVEIDVTTKVTIELEIKASEAAARGAMQQLANIDRMLPNGLKGNPLLNTLYETLKAVV